MLVIMALICVIHMQGKLRQHYLPLRITDPTKKSRTRTILLGIQTSIPKYVPSGYVKW